MEFSYEQFIIIAERYGFLKKKGGSFSLHNGYLKPLDWIYSPGSVYVRREKSLQIKDRVEPSSIAPQPGHGRQGGNTNSGERGRPSEQE